MSRRHAVALLVLVVLGAGTALSQVVGRVAANRENSRQRFAQVEIGQPQQEVVDILGDADPTIQDLATSDACTVYVEAHETVDPFVELCFDDVDVLIDIRRLKPR